MSKRKYSEPQAWSIFLVGIVIGIIISSIFWAYITSPKTKKMENNSSIANITGNKTTSYDRPTEFVFECRKIDGTPKWDSTGYRSCAVVANNQKNLLTMNLFCKKYALNLSSGSFGIKCEGKE